MATVNEEMYTHNPYLRREVTVGSLDEVREGDVIAFTYDGKQRAAFVLNPNYENKVHCLAMERIPRRVLLGEIISFMDIKLDGGIGPKQFYDANVGTTPVREYDAYRTFIISKMQNIRKVEYVINAVTWVKPDFTQYAGAIALAAQRFGIPVDTLLQRVNTGTLIQWPEPAWARLKNSASYKMPLNAIFEISRTYNDARVDNELASIEEAFRIGGEISAPIILFIGDDTENTPYLVSGEVKMAYARTTGILPKVWLVTTPSLDN